MLARGRRPLARDLRLVATQRVAALAAGARRPGARIAALLPPTARNGTYRVFACVRVRAPAREAVTANNCRLAGSVRIASTPQGRVAPLRSDDRAVTAVVGAEGGTVEATAGDGSVLRLVVPEGALATSLQLRLTPLAAVDGLAVPGATVLGGVEIEPAGLLLEAVARLEITPPAGAAAPSLAAAYELGGADLHLVPVLRRPAFAVLVTRLGGYVVLHADAPRTAAARVRLPARPLYRLEQAFAELQLGASARRAVAGVPAAEAEIASPAEARLLAAAEYVDVIRPELLQLAASPRLDPDAAIAAMLRLTLMLRQLDLLGIEDALPTAYAAEASELMQRIVRTVFDERLRRCKTGDVRSAVGMIGFFRRASGGAPIGVPPFAHTVDETLGEGWDDRAHVCLTLRFRFALSTSNEWRQGDHEDREHSVADVAWNESATLEARLNGYSALGEPTTSLINSWQQGALLKWSGTEAINVSGLVPLERYTAPSDPSTCNAPIDAATILYREPLGALTVEIVPVIESFDTAAQRLDTSGKLQVRFAEEGGPHQIYHCPQRADDFDLGIVAVFKAITVERGDTGVFRALRQELTAAGKERWYTLPLQGGDQDLSGGGLIAYYGPPVPWSTWATNGLFTVEVIPPG